MLLLDLWGISFHAMVVFGLGRNLLFKSILGRGFVEIKVIKNKIVYIKIILTHCELHTGKKDYFSRELRLL